MTSNATIRGLLQSNPGLDMGIFIAENQPDGTEKCAFFSLMDRLIKKNEIAVTRYFTACTGASVWLYTPRNGFSRENRHE
tara:strand:+ start:6962 stop:7201 length:240 start_codon:yes stop_codon:yes gene_type:complete